MNRKKEWKTFHTRPEDEYKNARFYYDEKEASRYANSNSMRKMQRELTLRALELYLPPLNFKILDSGCGCGFSLEVLREIGYENIKGFDLTPQFIQIAQKKGFNVKVGNLLKIPYFEKFNVIISISALQWLTSANIEENISKVAKEFKRVLEKNGVALIQFYPSSEKELMQTAKTFNNSNFKVQVVTDNPRNAKKRKTFIVLKI